MPPRLYGGIERIVDVLVRRLRAAGHTVGLAARPGSECPADALLRLARTELALPFRYDLQYALPLEDREGVQAGPGAQLLARRLSAATAARPHTAGDVLSTRAHVAYVRPRRKTREAGRDHLHWAAATTSQRRGRPAGGDWHGIPNFADTEALTLSPSVPDDAPLVFLSRVEEIKGAHWAIEIARRTGRRLVIAGNHSTGNDPEGEFWRRRIAPEIGKGGIEYVGPVDDAQKNALLGQARAMVVPIQWDEPFGIVFAEALACGTPVISCPRGALPEIVRPGVDGFLIKSIEEGCEAVERVGALDRAECRRRAEDHFSADAVGGALPRPLWESQRSTGVGMKRRIALVSGHFAPSNLVGAHRARLWSRYLPEFGWEPVVVTGDPAKYEERPDPDLERLVPAGLEVVHAATLSTRPIRLVGDIGVRAFWGCYRALSSMAKAGQLDFVLVTIPSNYLAPVGRLLHLRRGVPFGIDYQDPWVNRWPGIEVPFSRAWTSYRLASLLEPWSVRDAALITGMAPGYVAGMLERNPDVARRSVLAYMSMGSAPEDYALVRDLQRKPFLFQPGDGHFHLIYAGALLPAGLVVLDAFLAGLRALREQAPQAASRLRVHFVGTGSSPDDPQGHPRPAACRGRRCCGYGQRASASNRLRRCARPSDAKRRRPGPGVDRTALHPLQGLSRRSCRSGRSSRCCTRKAPPCR